MRDIAAAAFLVIGAASALSAGQGSLLSKAPVQHATVLAVSGASSVTRGNTTTLWAEVTPHPSVHVYAEGAKDFTAVSLKANPHPAITLGKAHYPKPDVGGKGLDDPPAYASAFRIGLPVSVSSVARPGDVVTIAGAVTYQACDDRMCYPVTSAPVTWALTVK